MHECTICSLQISPTDLYFLIQWLEEEEGILYDVMPARDIVPEEGQDAFSLRPGDECKACFANKQYPARVLATGKCKDSIWYYQAGGQHVLMNEYKSLAVCLCAPCLSFQYNYTRVNC